MQLLSGTIAVSPQPATQPTAHACADRLHATSTIRDTTLVQSSPAQSRRNRDRQLKARTHYLYPTPPPISWSNPTQFAAAQLTTQLPLAIAAYAAYPIAMGSHYLLLLSVSCRLPTSPSYRFPLPIVLPQQQPVLGAVISTNDEGTFVYSTTLVPPGL
jgi:hypothetical protein